MTKYKLLTCLTAVLFSCNAMAFYGAGTTQTKTCKPPTLLKFNPPHLTVVSPESKITFQASKLTSPKSISVLVKKQKVDLIIEENNDGYLVSAKLPSSLKDTYARIDINASALDGCMGVGGWLLNIRNEAQPVADL